MPAPDDLHEQSLRSWVESARDAADFPIQNLPLCRYVARDGSHHAGVRIGDELLSLGELHRHRLLDLDVGPNWQWFASAAPLQRRALRGRLISLLSRDAGELRDNARARAACMTSVHEAKLLTPIDVSNYSDFYASLYHATNVGSMFRPDNPLLPNYKHIPIGYHGRASSIVASGTPVRRPSGQLRPDDAQPPQFAPCRNLDYELELGVLVSRGNTLGHPIPIAEADTYMLGLCIVNDWSARDIQRWEYQPLGPFLSKSFATTIGPYIVTTEALAPFRCPLPARDAQDPTVLPYLDAPADLRGGFDITVEASLSSELMRGRGMPPHRLSRGSFKDMYWTFAQMLTHHASNGCNLRPGDLIASGTISGARRDARGCLMELTWDGDPWGSPPRPEPGSKRTAITLPTGEQRTFLADGDEVTLTAWCERPGLARIGLGSCTGVIQQAIER